MKTLVLGLGNLLCRDDGVGIKVAREIGRRVLSPSIEVAEASIAGLELLERILGYSRVVLIDSIQVQGKGPGDVLRLKVEDLRTTARLSSPHDVNFATALELGKQLGLKIPEAVAIYAIQAEDVTTFDEDCSASIEKAIPLIAEEIIQAEGWRAGSLNAEAAQG